MISIDGTSGEVFLGEVPVVPSPVVQLLRGRRSIPTPATTALVKSVHRLMVHADEARRLGVRANADTPEDAARARRFGAEGIGLCRTEHMFLGDRRQLVERAHPGRHRRGPRRRALARALPMQRQDFIEILEAMDGLPVTIRLLDPPLHEFLPITELSVEVALAEADRATAEEIAAARRGPQDCTSRTRCSGLRGVRLGLVVPGLFALQVRAIAEAAAQLKKAGKDPRPRS